MHNVNLVEVFLNGIIYLSYRKFSFYFMDYKLQMILLHQHILFQMKI